MNNTICTSLSDFEYYDKIIQYGYYHSDFFFNHQIELYQDYILNTAYLCSKQMNKMVDKIMYNYVTDEKFRKFMNLNMNNDDFFSDFKDTLINLYSIYQKIEKNNQKRQPRWL